MPPYYMPKTKKEMIQWIKQRYFVRGQTTNGLDKKPIKQLQAIYFELINKVKEGTL